MKVTNRLLSLLLALVMIVGTLPAIGLVSAAETTAAEINSIPAVREVTYAESGAAPFTLTTASRFYIVSDTDPTGSDLGTYVQTASVEFASKGYPSADPLGIVYGPESGVLAGDVVVKIDPSVATRDEQYNMTVDADNVTVVAHDAAAVLHALHTVLQSMVSAGTVSLKAVTSLVDYPDVSERSLFLDCGRVFFEPATLKALIHTLSWNKMNVLYLDFSNNNATRFFLDEMEITVGGTTYDITTAKPSDGYLTQSDMDGILAEAAKYGVQVIPSFNSPGHIGGLKNVSGASSLFYTASAADYDSACGGKTVLNILDSTVGANAMAFGQEVTKLYTEYFASKGVKNYSIAADESKDVLSNMTATNATFVSYVNSLNDIVKASGMKTRMFNDAITDANTGIDTDITILYWVGTDMSAEELLLEGYDVVNFTYTYLYYAHGASSYWNCDPTVTYAWNPGQFEGSIQLSYTSGNQPAYTANGAAGKLKGAAFAIWTDYAFNVDQDGEDVLKESACKWQSGSYGLKYKIYILGERTWSRVSDSVDYTDWRAEIINAPAGIVVSTGAVDTTTLPEAPAIAAAKLLNEVTALPVTGTIDNTVTVAAYDLTHAVVTSVSSLPDVPGAAEGKVVAYDIVPYVNDVKYEDSAIVKFSIPDGWDHSRVVAFVVNDNGSLSLIHGTVDSDGNYVYTAPHFSVNGLAELEAPALDTFLGSVGTKTETNDSVSEWRYVTNGVEGVVDGDQYLIVIDANADYALTSTGGRTGVTISNNVITSVDASAVWTFEGDDGEYYLKDSNGRYLYPTYEEWSYDLLKNQTTGQLVTVSGTSTVTIGRQVTSGWYTTTSFLIYSDGFSASRNSTAFKLFAKYEVEGSEYTAYTVDTSKLQALIDHIDALNMSSASYTTDSWSAFQSALSAAEAAINGAADSYTTESAAQTYQNTVNTAATNLYNAWLALELMSDNHVLVSIICELYDENGVDLIGTNTSTVWVEKGDTATVNAPSVGGYDVVGDTSKIIDTDSVTSVTFKYQKKSFYIENSILMPISIIDYRSDGLLFDYDYWDHNSYAYSLVHSYQIPAHGTNSNSGSEYGDSFDGTNYGTAIAGTRLEIANRFSGDINGYWSSGRRLNSGWIRTGMVEAELGTNGFPVYTDATVVAVANLLRQGIYKDLTSSEKNYNTVISDTFLAEDAPRSVLADETPTEMSAAFAAAHTFANITNAYDLAWYLLNTLYLPDTEMVTDNGHTVPVYGMGNNTYYGIILKQMTDDTGTYYAYDAAYPTTYDRENGYIYNTDTPGEIITDKSEMVNRFWPIDGESYDELYGATTSMQAGSGTQNGNFALAGTAQFVYKPHDYFYFSGDDDVYLFINGKLAVDLGGAHGVCYKEIYLSDLDAEYYGLVEGEVATFSFFYLERCSDNSNFSMRTNITLANRDLQVGKTAYSAAGAEIANGSVANDGSTFFYEITATNTGNADISGITITDTDEVGTNVVIGAGADTSTAVLGQKTVNGQYEISLGYGSFLYYITNATGEIEREEFDTLAELSDAIAEITLGAGETLHVRFLSNVIDVEDGNAVNHVNSVKITAAGGYNDVAQHIVYSYAPGSGALVFVVDYGIPMVITADDLALPKYSADNGYATNVALSSKNNAAGSVSNVTLAGNFVHGVDQDLELTYTLNSMLNKIDTIYLDVTYEFHEYQPIFEKVIYVIPATSVYYEDDFVDFDGAWTDVTDNSVTEAFQKADELGNASANDYGYDDAYANCDKYSLGSAKKVTVSGSDFATASFSFVGTGFDLVSLTSNKTGTIVVNVTNGDTFDNYYLVDTYYQTGDELYQIPVMKVVGLDYDEYDVTITVAYDVFFEHGQGDSYDFYLDAVRIYDPLGDYADSLYKQDGEGWPKVEELRELIISAGSFDKETTDALEGAVFIDNKHTGATVSDYETFGPNNEVYLAPGQAVSFNLADDDNVADVQIALKAVNGSVNYKIYEVGNIPANSETVATSTDMYRSIYDLMGKNVVIVNTSESDSESAPLLSITTVKTTYKDLPTAEQGIFVITPKDADLAAATLGVALADSFEADKVSVEPTFDTVKLGDTITLKIKTSEDVEYLIVNGVKVTEYVNNGWTGDRFWTIEIPADEIGELAVTVYAFDADGSVAEGRFATVNVVSDAPAINSALVRYERIKRILDRIAGMLDNYVA